MKFVSPRQSIRQRVARASVLRRALLAPRRSWQMLENESSEVISFSHPDYIGVTHSTRTLLPHWYALREEDLCFGSQTDEISRALSNSNVRCVVFSGFAKGYSELIRTLARKVPRIRVLALWHGTTLQNIDDCNWRSLRILLELAREGLIENIGFLKAGMAELFARNGIPSARLQNFVSQIPKEASQPRADGLTHLGLWTLDHSWRKNPYAMIAAAALVERSSLSGIFDDRMLEWCQLLSIPLYDIHRGPLPPSDLAVAIRPLHCNLYITLSECSPLFPLESLAQGVPCLVSPTSPVFDGSTFLQEKLIVTRFDEPHSIAKKIREVCDERSAIIAAYREHAPEYIRVAKESLAYFLSLESDSWE